MTFPVHPAGRIVVWALALTACAGASVEAQSADTTVDSTRTGINARALDDVAPTDYPDASGESYPAVVDDSLNLHWRALNGASLYGEDQPNEYYKRTGTDEYALLVSPNGDTSIELTHHRVVLRMTGIRFFENAHEALGSEERTVLALKGDMVQRADFSRRNTAASDSSAPFVSRLIVASDSAEAHSGAWRSRSKVPRGVIPSDEWMSVVAALPDTLERPAIVWTVVARSAGILVTADTVTFGRASEMDLPFADDGASCTRETKTHNVRMKVVKVKATSRYSTVELLVLASTPHLRVGPTVRCLSIPGVH